MSTHNDVYLEDTRLPWGTLPPPRRHGTSYAYNVLRCHCGLCTDAAALARAKYETKSRAKWLATYKIYGLSDHYLSIFDDPTADAALERCG